MAKRLSMGCLLAFFCMFVVVQAATPQDITVMTRNLYLGADLAPVMSATTQQDFLAAIQLTIERIAATNFPQRAQVLAAEIVEKKPHLVALQEVYDFTLDGGNGPLPFRDYLTDLKDALAAQGADYKVAAVVTDSNLLIPVGGNVIGVTDRDVILARSDVSTNIVNLDLACSRPSSDGCNYLTVASTLTPIGPVSLERGFVAVDVLSGTSPVRFVNTHLEEREIGPPLVPPLLIQAAQAHELISILNSFPNPHGLPIIVAGDFNSSPQDLSPGYGITPPYIQFIGAGYWDTWKLRPGKPPGFTCCQAENLLNIESTLNERVDLTFINMLPVGTVKANDTGNEEKDKTPSGLWPSDHAGVVTRLEVAP